ncbi:hypothetical protein MMPV_005512 [Pyropia vietnamensis]
MDNPAGGLGPPRSVTAAAAPPLVDAPADASVPAAPRGGGGHASSGGDGGGDGGGGGGSGGSPPSSSPPPLRRRRPPSVASSLRRVRQQTLPSFTPTLSVRTMVFLYYGLGVFFVPIGVAVLVGSARIGRSATLRYDMDCVTNVSLAANVTGECVLPLVVPRSIQAPSYFYYRVTGMQQNARRYVKSRSHKQLRGEWPLSAEELRQCDPLTFVGDTLINGGSGVDEDVADEDGRPRREVLVPCGLTAASEFNDTLTLCADKQCASPIPLSTDGIAWAADSEVSFQPRIPVVRPWTPAINERITSPRFQVWMRLSAFANFDKLYGIIRTDLPADTYYVRVASRFPVAPFGGTKAVFVANTAWFGGRNVFLGVLYVVVGLLCLVSGSAFLTYHLVRPRRRAYDDPALVQAALVRLTAGVPRSARRRRRGRHLAGGGVQRGRGEGTNGVSSPTGALPGRGGDKVSYTPVQG